MVNVRNYLVKRRCLMDTYYFQGIIYIESLRNQCWIDDNQNVYLDSMKVKLTLSPLNLLSLVTDFIF
jgi:hypothetical protein